MSAIGIHIVNVGLFPVDAGGNVVQRNNATLRQIINGGGHDHRIVPDSDIVNSVDYPTIKAYLEAEAADGYELNHIDQAMIITVVPSGGGGAADLSNLNADNLTSGTIPDARFPATLPAVSGVNLTALNASNLGSGTVAAARLPATIVYTDSANTFTKAQSITPDSDAVAMIVKANALNQTANVSEIKNAANALQGSWNSFGLLTVNGLDATTVPSAATVTSAICTSKLVTFTTSSAHNFYPGLLVQTNNLSPTISNMNTTGYAWHVRSCPTTNTFTVNVNVADFGATSTTGTFTPKKSLPITPCPTTLTATSDYGSVLDISGVSGMGGIAARVYAQASQQVPLSCVLHHSDSGGTLRQHIIGQSHGSEYSYDWRIGYQSAIVCFESITWLALQSAGGATGLCTNTIENQFTGPLVIGATGNTPATTTGKDVGLSRRAAGILGINGGNYQKVDTTADVLRMSVSGRIYANAVTAPTFSSGSVTSNVATITCTAAHNIANNQYVKISGVTGVVIADGTYLVTVTSTTAFTFAYTVGNGTISAATITPVPILNLGGAPTTGDALSDVIIGASATTQKPLVIQGKGSQTANLTEWQSSTGALLGAVSAAGLITTGGTPNATGLAAAGTTSGAVLTNTANGDNCLTIIGNASHSGNLIQCFQVGTSTRPFYITGSGIPVLNTTQFTGVNLLNSGAELQYVDSALTTGTMTKLTKGIRTQFATFTWSNAMVTALGATITGDVKVCTLPARTIVKNVWILVDNTPGGITTLTVSVGRESGGGYVDYIPASTLNGITPVTVYGNTAGSRGTNNNGFDLPSYNSGTTDVFARFISTGANLSAVTTCTGVVVIESAISP